MRATVSCNTTFSSFPTTPKGKRSYKEQHDHCPYSLAYQDHQLKLGFVILSQFAEINKTSLAWIRVLVHKHLCFACLFCFCFCFLFLLFWLLTWISAFHELKFLLPKGSLFCYHSYRIMANISNKQCERSCNVLTVWLEGGVINQTIWKWNGLSLSYMSYNIVDTFNLDCFILHVPNSERTIIKLMV